MLGSELGFHLCSLNCTYVYHLVYGRIYSSLTRLGSFGGRRKPEDRPLTASGNSVSSNPNSAPSVAAIYAFSFYSVVHLYNIKFVVPRIDPAQLPMFAFYLPGFPLARIGHHLVVMNIRTYESTKESHSRIETTTSKPSRYGEEGWQAQGTPLSILQLNAGPVRSLQPHPLLLFLMFVQAPVLLFFF